MNIDQKIKDRVKKLLNLASDAAAFDGEIDNALRAARKLMLEHNITERDLGDTPKEQENKRHMVYSYGCHVSTWEGVLMQAVTKLVGSIGCYKTSTMVEKRTALDTLAFDDKGNIQSATQLYFYGPEEDARDGADLFEEWAHVIATMARLKHGGCFKGNGRSYAEGFATALHSKVVQIDKDERELVIAGTHGTALVLQGARANMLEKQSAAKKWLQRALGVKLEFKRRRPNRNDRDAYGEGYKAGYSSDFSRTITRKIGV